MHKTKLTLMEYYSRDQIVCFIRTQYGIGNANRISTNNKWLPNLNMQTLAKIIEAPHLEDTDQGFITNNQFT